MIRKQTSKILVFLLMLGILYGCKRQILDPLNPQKNLPPKVQLDKLKGFYENGRYKNQPKRSSSNGNERMTAADSARFKDFEPEWDKTEVELLPNNEKMLIVPVVRFLSVQYNQEVGFIRRLCIRVDENEDFLEANIVELVGNLTFVKSNYNNIFANYKSANITGFEGVVIVYALNYDILTAKFYSGGVFKENTVIATQNVPANTQWVIVCPTTLVSVWIPGVCPHGNDGLPAHGTSGECSGSGHWETTVVVGQCVTQGGIGGNSGGTDTPPGNQPTGGGGTYEPITTPRPPKGYEIPPVVVTTPTVPRPPYITPQDSGISWDYVIDGDTPVSANDAALLKSLDSLSNGLGPVDRATEMGVADKIQLATTLRELRRSSPAYEKMYQALRAEAQKPDSIRRSLVFKILPATHPADGVFLITPGSPDLNVISIKATSLRNASIVAEEFLHALDTMVVRKNDPDVNNPNPVNYEFDAKTAMLIIWRKSLGQAPLPQSLWHNAPLNAHISNGNTADLSNQERMNWWLRVLQFSPNQQFDTYNMGEYFEYMILFRIKQQPYYPSFIAPPANKQPKLLFFLFN